MAYLGFNCLYLVKYYTIKNTKNCEWRQKSKLSYDFLKKKSYNTAIL